MRIVAVEAEAWTLALKAPFVIAARTAYQAQNVRVTLRMEDAALIGLGESAPVGYVTGESVESVLTAIRAADTALAGHSITRLGPLLARAAEALPNAPAACAGVEMALYDAWARYWRLPLWQHFGACRSEVITDLTIPLVTPEEAQELTRQAFAEGMRHFKIKVGDAQGHEADLARIAAIAQAVPQAALRIDANQAFAPDEAVQFARAVARTGAAVELLEQPVAKEDMEGLQYVTRHSPFPVFADEAARDVPSVLRLLKNNAVHGINIKFMKCGISAALQIIALCRAAGIRLMLGCMLESPLGIAAAAQVAGGTGAFDFLDLDSHRLLAPVPGLSGGFREEGGRFSIGEAGPGWGVDHQAEKRVIPLTDPGE